MWPIIGILFGVSLVFCIIGFKKYVYFLSIGYGLSIFGISLVTLILIFINQFSSNGIFGIYKYDLNAQLLPFVLLIIQSVLLMVYGFRLGGFLLLRIIKSKSYNKEVKDVTKDNISLFAKFIIWIIVGVLYLSETSGLFIRFTHNGKEIIAPIIGISISIIGFVLETIADAQKSKQKKSDPHMVATKGLYKMCRCPNYFGEIVFWTGVFISGVTTYSNPFEWIFAIFGFISIVYVMFNGAKRLEKRQFNRLRDNETYIEYSNKTPIIIPLIPLYHLYNEEKENIKRRNKK